MVVVVVSMRVVAVMTVVAMVVVIISQFVGCVWISDCVSVFCLDIYKQNFVVRVFHSTL